MMTTANTREGVHKDEQIVPKVSSRLANFKTWLRQAFRTAKRRRQHQELLQPMKRLQFQRKRNDRFAFRIKKLQREYRAKDKTIAAQDAQIEVLQSSLRSVNNQNAERVQQLERSRAEEGHYLRMESEQILDDAVAAALEHADHWDVCVHMIDQLEVANCDLVVKYELAKLEHEEEIDDCADYIGRLEIANNGYLEEIGRLRRQVEALQQELAIRLTSRGEEHKI